jgi:hypothetical protein
MTAADQIVRSAKIVLAMEGRPHMGRPLQLAVHQRQDALKTLADDTLSRADLASQFNVSHRAMSRLSL